MNDFARYEKQLLFSPLGLQGQKRLLKSRVGILGAGALGSNLANLLGRSGVGQIVIADQDRVELSNLQRQVLFTEKDIGHPKALRIARRLGKINSEISIEAFYQTVNEENFLEIFKDCLIIFDATDNFKTRFLLNKMSIKLGIPWVFSGVTASSGQSMLIVPGKTPCLGCLIPDEATSENYPTVHNSGILNTIVATIASISVTTGIKYLIDKQVDSHMVFFDIWEKHFNKILVQPSENCCCCRLEKLRSR